MLPRNVTRHGENLIFGVDVASYPIGFMLSDCITYDIDMILLWWMGVAKSRYQFNSSFRGFFSMVTLWFVSNIDNPTSTDKIFEKNSSFHVKLRTMGKVQFLFSRSLLLVLTKLSFYEEDWALGYTSMKF